jgi:hypothetical protein
LLIERLFIAAACLLALLIVACLIVLMLGPTPLLWAIFVGRWP